MIRASLEGAEKRLTKQKRTPAAKAALQVDSYGTDKSVPLNKTVFSSGEFSRQGRLSIIREQTLPEAVSDSAAFIFQECTNYFVDIYE